MAIKAMRKISIRGSLQELRVVIEELKATQAFELSSFKRGKAEDVDSPVLEHYTTLLARINAVLENSASNGDKKNRGRYNRPLTLKFEELKKLGERDGEVLKLLEIKEQKSIRANEIRAAINKSKDTIKDLSAFTSLDAPLNTLVSTKNSYVLYGLLPKLQLEKFREDYDLSEMELLEFGGEGEDVGIVIIAHKSDQVLVDTVFDYGFRQANFNFDATASGQIDSLRLDIQSLQKEGQEVCLSIVLSDAEVVLLKQYHDYAQSELDTENILAGTLKSKDFYILNGWVLDSQKKNLEILIFAINPKTRIKWGRTVTLDAPPVVVKNSKLVEPYQSITNMYGAPGKKDMDPNPFVAFFYFLFFGMMIGDAGYGLIMGAATLFILFKIKPQNASVKNLIMIVAMGAFSTILWGIFFMSFFGLELSFLPNAPIDPINDPLMFMILAMGVGVLHLVAGICLKFYNLYRQGKILDAIFDAGFRVMFFVGAIITVIGTDMVLGIDLLFTIGLAITLTFVAGIALTAGRKNKGIMGKAVGGFGGIYSFVNYISDILSYARLFALGLVGAVVALVANTMAGMFMGPWWGYPIGILVAVIFHTFNLALAVLSAYIHNARLQFIEFFSKFYEGSGTVFIPMGGDLRFVRVLPKEVGAEIQS